MNISRRALLGSAAAGLAANSFAFAQKQQPRRANQTPKNIIFCVADGMSTQTMAMADHFRQLQEGKRSYWSELLDHEGIVRGWQDTRSLNSIVTDSAAASSSWGSGRHIWNGQLNEFPDGTKLRTLVNLMTEAKVRCGLVTTTTATHATPAGFTVNCEQRDLEALIAERYLASGIDVLMGGGSKFFDPAQRKDKRDLYADFVKAGFTVARTRGELLASKGNKKLLGIYASGHLPYSVDRDNSNELMETVPTLAEMVRAAIPALDGGPNGFLLQVEGGKVDHGGHANDWAAMVYDQIAFEEAVRAAIEFAQRDGQTLVVVTADHATGGPSLNGAGPEYGDSTAGLKTLAKMTASYDVIFGLLGKAPTASQVREVIEAKLGIVLSGDEADAVAKAFVGDYACKISELHRSKNSTLSMALSNYTKVNWTSGNHTSEHVMVTSFGPGNERLHGLNPNVSFFDTLLDFKGLKWSNPTMTFEKAKEFMDKKKQTLDRDLFDQYADPSDSIADHRTAW